MSSATPLPPPRRIITAHKPNGDITIQDDTVQLNEFSPGLLAGSAFVQTSLSAPDAATAIEGAGVKPQGLVTENGLQARWLDISPGCDSPMHYTDTIDYFVVLHGKLQVALHDGQLIDANQGDVLVQIANVHQLRNVSDSVARVFVIVVPCKAIKVDGKTLSEVTGAMDFTGGN